MGTYGIGFSLAEGPQHRVPNRGAPTEGPQQKVLSMGALAEGPQHRVPSWSLTLGDKLALASSRSCGNPVWYSNPIMDHVKHRGTDAFGKPIVVNKRERERGGM